MFPGGPQEDRPSSRPQRRDERQRFAEAPGDPPRHKGQGESRVEKDGLHPPQGPAGRHRGCRRRRRCEGRQDAHPGPFGQKAQPPRLHLRRIHHRQDYIHRAGRDSGALQQHRRAPFRRDEGDICYPVGIYRISETVYPGNKRISRLHRRAGFHNGESPDGARHDCRRADNLRQRRDEPPQSPPSPSGEGAAEGRPRDSPADPHTHPVEEDTPHLGAQRRRQVGLPEDGGTASVYVPVGHAHPDLGDLRAPGVQPHPRLHRRRPVHRQRPLDIFILP